MITYSFISNSLYRNHVMLHRRYNWGLEHDFITTNLNILQRTCIIIYGSHTIYVYQREIALKQSYIFMQSIRSKHS